MVNWENLTPLKINMSPKKVPYQKEMSSSKHNFSGEMLVFVGAVLLFRRLGLKLFAPEKGPMEERKVCLPTIVSRGELSNFGDLYRPLFRSFKCLLVCLMDLILLIFDLRDHFLTKCITIWCQNLHCMDCFSHPLWKFLRKAPSTMISGFDQLKEWILGGSS